MNPKSNIVVVRSNIYRGGGIEERARCYIQLTKFSKNELSTILGVSKFSMERCPHIRPMGADVNFLSFHIVPIKLLGPPELENIGIDKRYNFADTLPEIVMKKIQENEFLFRKYSEGLPPLKTAIVDQHTGPVLIDSSGIDITKKYYVRLSACGMRGREAVWVETVYFPLKMLEDAMDSI